MKLGRREHKSVKKQDLTWKSSLLLFQSLPWKSKAEKLKASFDVCQAGGGENTLDSMPRDLERAKAKF
jgi:hypothetical protein